jgi:hypothetical protein
MAAKAGSKKSEIRKPTAKAAQSSRASDVERDDDISEFDPEKFVGHVKNINTLKSKAASIRGEIGAAVKAAEEDHGIHRGAAALWIKLERMEDEARDAFLKAFDDMRVALGRAEQGELVFTERASAPAPGLN